MTGERYVLDASALLAMLAREPGGDAVATVISIGLISAVNWSEVVQKARTHDVEVGDLKEDLESLGVEIVSFGPEEAGVAADLWHRGARSLALADRACLATALVRGHTALTADRAWAALDLGVEVQLIR